MRTVVHVGDLIRPGGGPPGYLHNLRTAFTSAGDGRVEPALSVASPLASEERTFSPARATTVRWAAICNGIPSERIRDRVWEAGRRLQAWARRRSLEAFFETQIAAAAAAVFHAPALFQAFLRFRSRRGLRTITGYMQHGPASLADEYLAGELIRLPQAGRTYRALRTLETENFQKADYVLVPFVESVEAYHVHDDLSRALGRARLVELPTGIPDPTQAVSSAGKLAHRRRFGLPGEAFVAGFFGRYHPHKGFDIFLEVARSTRSDRIMFISAGAGPLRAPRLPNLRDLGWRTDVLALMAACDVIILPNRYTYFDIVALEAMALSLPVVASFTGGNKPLARLSGGVLTVRTNEPGMYVPLIEQLADDPDWVATAGRTNRAVYEREFTAERFLRRHLALAEQMLAGAH